MKVKIRKTKQTDLIDIAKLWKKMGFETYMEKRIKNCNIILTESFLNKWILILQIE